jgi:hypothetical protein
MSTRRRKTQPQQAESLFDAELPIEPKTDQQAEVGAAALEDLSALEDLTTAVDRHVGKTALEGQLYDEENEVSGDFYNIADGIVDDKIPAAEEDPQAGEQEAGLEDFPLGDSPNTFNEVEGKEIERLRSQGLSFPNAFGQATKRKYQFPPKPKKRSRRRNTKPKPLYGRAATIADANSGDQDLR